MATPAATPHQWTAVARRNPPGARLPGQPEARKRKNETWTWTWGGGSREPVGICYLLSQDLGAVGH